MVVWFLLHLSYLSWTFSLEFNIDHDHIVSEEHFPFVFASSTILNHFRDMYYSRMTGFGWFWTIDHLYQLPILSSWFYHFLVSSRISLAWEYFAAPGYSLINNLHDNPPLLYWEPSLSKTVHLSSGSTNPLIGLLVVAIKFKLLLLIRGTSRWPDCL